MADEKSDKGFSVVDRRIGTDEEESRQEEQKGAESEGAGETDAKERKYGEDTSQGPGTAQSEDETSSPDSRASEKDGASAGAGGAEGQVPPANFPSFLLSLHSAALIHLGLVPNPSDNQVRVDLPIARYHIDLLEMLEKKTRGNLDEEEEKLIKNILYELRMAFLEVSKNQ